MIGDPKEETNVDLQTKMVAEEQRRLHTIQRQLGIKAAVLQAARDIVKLKIDLARAQLVKPTKLDDGTPPDLGPINPDGERG